MPALEDRVEALERRVSEWEGQLGFFVPLVRQLHREILSTREDVQRLGNRVERLESRVERVEEKVDRGFALMSEKFRDVDERFVKLESTLEALPRVLAEEIARRRS
jgi:chromosome segregation ATPase